MLVAVVCGALTGSAIQAQTTVNAIFSPGVPTRQTFTCTDNFGNAASNCQITLTVTAVAQTNGHFHEGPPGYPMPPHPVSTLCAGTCNANSTYSSTISGCSDQNGNFTFTLLPTLIGQEEYLTGTSTAQAGCTKSRPLGNWGYAVGYSDLIYFSDPDWKHIGGYPDTPGAPNTGHGSTQYNQWMQQATHDALQATVTAWQQLSGSCKICTNDAALPNGGKFDINVIRPYTGSNYTPIPGYGNYRPWSAPHSQHDRGSAVDVNASGNEGCQYPVTVNQFVNLCKNNGFGGAAYTFNEGNHAHCGLAVTFPH